MAAIATRPGGSCSVFPGVIAVHREDIIKYRDKEFPAEPLGIADLS